MKIILRSIICLVMMFTTVNVMAQSAVFEDVVSARLQNTVTIMNNKDIVGYALLYKLEKLKKAALYRLEILDENLKSIGSNEFEAGKSLEMESALYESGQIMLAMKDPSSKAEYNRYVMTFDLKGKQTGNIGYEPEEGRKGMYGKAMAEMMEDFYNGYTNSEGKGFVTVYQNELKTGGAEVRMIGTNGKLKWSKNFTAEKGDRLDMYLLESTANTVIMFSIERNGLMKRDGAVFLMGLDANNGKQLFKKPMEVGSYAFEPYLFKRDPKGKLKMVSFLSDAEDKILKARILGFNISSIDEKTGELTESKNYLYSSELSNVLEMKTETKSEEGFMRIHDLSFMKDGSVVAVGEFFRRTVSAMGVASNVLSGGRGTPVTQITIGDMFLLRFDNAGKAKSLEKIEKGKERVQLPGDGMSLGLLARWLAMNKYFGYSYTDESSETGKVTVVAGGDFEGENYATAAISFDENKGFKIKKFVAEREKGQRIYVGRGKPGYVLVYKYSAKKKQITMNLEKVS